MENDRITRFDCIPSTSTLLMEQADRLPDGTVFLARRQSAGRGRTGKSFDASAPGAYLSMLIHTEGLPTGDVMNATAMAGVEVCRALDALTGLSTQLRWVNDILWNGKKLGGILCEAAGMTTEGCISRLVIGVGINTARRAFPPELQDIAVSLAQACEAPPDDESVCTALIAGLDRLRRSRFQPLQEYRAEYAVRCATLGRRVQFLQEGVPQEGTAVGLGEGFELLVDTSFGRVTIRSGETRILF